MITVFMYQHVSFHVDDARMALDMSLMTFNQLLTNTYLRQRWGNTSFTDKHNKTAVFTVHVEFKAELCTLFISLLYSIQLALILLFFIVDGCKIVLVTMTKFILK